MSIRFLLAVGSVFLISACASSIVAVDPRTACEAANFTVLDDFAGARRGRCTVLADDRVRITILPEDAGYINDSPWFAFKVVPKTSGTAKITMHYRGGHHRYLPKQSVDALHWTPVDTDTVEVSSDGRKVTLSLTLGDQAVWISGQELITPRLHDIWNGRMAEHDEVQLSVLGQSKLGRPIHVLKTEPVTENVLFLIARQHPPEVSGVFAFLAFYEELLSDNELANAFRARFQVIAVPVMNPDGIIGGNWRHNFGGTDLNRDWGPFKQPETVLIKNLLDELEANGKQPRVFLDFHSTKRNVFYTQDEENPTQPPLFARTWLENAKPRIRNYPFDNDENPTDQPGVAKNYMYHRYGIPASTYEVGDETNRAATKAAARIFAQELMELMLAEVH